ncbi:MAG: putative toxin-antitoxin system toxin component, PIN family [Blastocatellales bacterium]
MKVVIDTNVVISAILKDRDPEAVILFVVTQREFEWIVSLEILKEYKEVMRRDKFGLPEEVICKWDEVLENVTTMIEAETPVEFLRDRKDAKFLACALAVEAEYLVTGDKDFSEARKLVNTTIISVSSFKKLVCDVWN